MGLFKGKFKDPFKPPGLLLIERFKDKKKKSGPAPSPTPSSKPKTPPVFPEIDASAPSRKKTRARSGGNPGLQI